MTNDKMPNCIFILADGFSWNDLGCYVCELDKTPRLDALVKQGKLFTKFYTNSLVSSTTSVSLMTGRFPLKSENYLSEEKQALTKLLKNNGYVTAHFGRWHLSKCLKSTDINSFGYSESKCCNLNDLNYLNDLSKSNLISEIINNTISFINRNKETSFYVNVWLPQIAMGSNINMQEYYAALAEMDRQIGRLLDEVDELGLSQDTIICFTGDNRSEDVYSEFKPYHALGMPGPLKGSKLNLYENALRLPLIVRWLTHTPANSIDSRSVMSAADIMPTLLSLASIDFDDAAFDGEDMSKAFTCGYKDRVKTLYWENFLSDSAKYIKRTPMVAVREGDWKLLVKKDGSGMELYNMKRQAMELFSVESTYPELARQLAEKAIEWCDKRSCNLDENKIEQEAFDIYTVSNIST